MSISLTNTTRRIKVINLPHKNYCVALGACACHQLPGRTGKRVASSLTLPAGATLTNIADAVLSVPAVARGVRAGELRVQRQPTTPPVPHDQLALFQSAARKRGDA